MSSGRSIGRKWPAPSTISRRLPGHELVGDVGVAHGDDLVAVAPDDHRGHLVGEVEAVAGADALAGDVDHGADRVDEGPLGPHVGEAGPRLPHLAEERIGPQPEPAEDAPGDAEHVVQLVAQDHRQHELGARDAEGPQQRA